MNFFLQEMVIHEATVGLGMGLVGPGGTVLLGYPGPRWAIGIPLRCVIFLSESKNRTPLACFTPCISSSSPARRRSPVYRRRRRQPSSGGSILLHNLIFAPL